MRTETRPLHRLLALLTLTGALFGPGCETSYPDIEAHCVDTCRNHPLRAVGSCVESFTLLREAADDAGCSADFDAYFACEKKEPPDTVSLLSCFTSHPKCAEKFDAIFACARKTASPTACDDANDRLRSCGESPNPLLEEHAPLCDGEPFLACLAECLADSSCAELDAARIDDTFYRCMTGCPSGVFF